MFAGLVITMQSPLLTIMVCLSVSVLLSLCTVNLNQSDSLFIYISVSVLLSVPLLSVHLSVLCFYLFSCPSAHLSVCVSVLMSYLCVCLFNCACCPTCISVIPFISSIQSLIFPNLFEQVRFSVILCLGPANIYFCIKVAQGFGYLAFKTIGASEELHSMLGFLLLLQI